MLVSMAGRAVVLPCLDSQVPGDQQRRRVAPSSIVRRREIRRSARPPTSGTTAQTDRYVLTQRFVLPVRSLTLLRGTCSEPRITAVGEYDPRVMASEWIVESDHRRAGVLAVLASNSDVLVRPLRAAE